MHNYIQDYSRGDKHDHCPSDMVGVPNITGEFSLDAVIVRSKHEGMLKLLSCYLKGDTYDSSKLDR